MVQVDVVQLVLRVKTVAASSPLHWSSIAVLVLLLVIKSLASVSKGHLPPGPRGLPLLGNIFQLPQFQWHRFSEWKDQFGPIFSLNLAGQPVIVLNNHEVTADLLDRRSHIYSDRPRSIMGGEILTGDIFVALVNHGELWRKLRRAGHESFNNRAVKEYQPVQEREAATLVSEMLREPDSLEDHFKRSTASSILSMIYAWPQIESKDDPRVTKIFEFAHRVTKACLPGAFLVEVLPVMKKLPCWMAKWKRDGLDFHREFDEIFKGFMDDMRAKIRTDGEQPSLATSLIKNSKQHELTPKESAWLAGTMLAAGADTTSASLAYFLLAMNLYPDVMHKGQREIDAVIGHDRMPTFADQPRLPYVRAIMTEVLRWRPVAPIGVPRRTSQDDWYSGYYIPKGTIVIPNIWAMNRDPEVFPDYEEFRPERFLDASGQVDINVMDTHGQGHVSFGFGRRICLGMHVANQALFINIATILWALNIERAVDANGTEILPSRTDCIDEGIVVRPVPFKCKITARSTDVAAAIKLGR